MADPTTTAALVLRAGSERREGFVHLHERLAPSLWLWANLHLPTLLRQRLAPEDLVQEVWARAFAGFAGFDASRAGFRSWLFGIAYNVLREQLRAFAQQPTRHVPPVAAGSATVNLEPGDGRTPVVHGLVRAETHAALLQAIAALDETDRKVVVWRGLEELPYAEVGARLALSPVAAESRFRRAVERLRALLPPDLASAWP